CKSCPLTARKVTEECRRQCAVVLRIPSRLLSVMSVFVMFRWLCAICGKSDSLGETSWPICAANVFQVFIFSASEEEIGISPFEPYFALFCTFFVTQKRVLLMMIKWVDGPPFVHAE